MPHGAPEAGLTALAEALTLVEVAEEQRREDFLVGQIARGTEKTKASDWDAFMVRSFLPGLFDVTAALEAHRREQLVLMLYSMRPKPCSCSSPEAIFLMHRRTA